MVKGNFQEKLIFGKEMLRTGYFGKKGIFWKEGILEKGIFGEGDFEKKRDFEKIRLGQNKILVT